MSPKLASTAISTGIKLTKGVVGLLNNRKRRMKIAMNPTMSDLKSPALIALSHA
jgi:hypothetical protein